MLAEAGAEVDDRGAAGPTVLIFGGIVLIVAATWDIVLGVANFLGRNWAASC